MIQDYFISCIRRRKTENINSFGKPISEFFDITIKGVIGRQGQNQYISAGKYTIDSEINFLCNDFDLQYGDLIIYKNITYEVASIPKNTVNRNHHIKANLRILSNVT